MRDIGGFVALLLIIFVVLYLTVRYVIPLILLYAGGAVVFFLLAGLIMRRGRRHPAHLNSYLKPGYARGLAVLAVLLPSLHAASILLFGLSDAWMMIGGANLVLPVAWTFRLLLLHFRQSSRFLKEGYDIEEVIEGSRDRAGILDLKIELLAAAELSRQAPEDWETAAGIADDDDSDLAGQIGRLTMDMKQLRAGYLELADTLQNILDGIRSGVSGRDECPRHLARFTEMDTLWAKVSREALTILDERTGHSPSGWD